MRTYICNRWIIEPAVRPPSGTLYAQTPRSLGFIETQVRVVEREDGSGEATVWLLHPLLSLKYTDFSWGTCEQYEGRESDRTWVMLHALEIACGTGRSLAQDMVFGRMPVDICQLLLPKE